MDLDALRKTAEEAPQGMWQASFDGSKITAFGGSSEGTATRWRIMCAYDPAAGRHAATFDPPTVLVLLDTAARAESAEAENARLRARLGAVEALANEYAAAVRAHLREGPHDRESRFAENVIADLRAALDSPTSHAQQEAEVGARVLREAADAFDSLSRTYDAMSRHWFAGRLRARADALAADTTGEPS